MTPASPPDFRLDGRVALITGAASGIGLASARAFAAAGARVVAVDLPGQGLGDSLHGEAFHRLELSVAEPDAPERIVAAARDWQGRLDIVFNNAGIATSALVARMEDADWERVIAVNLTAAFRICRAAIPLLVDSPAGRILNTASVMAEGSGAGLGAYSASKAGLVGLTRTLAIELGRHGITVNALLPGAIRTGMTAPLWQERPDIAEIWGRKAALRRLGEPEDVARAALFLASPAGGFVTGQALRVDGGLSLQEG